MSALSSFSTLQFDNRLGALLVGLIVSTVLFGITTLQTYIYYVAYRKDKAIHKWLVGFLWMLDFIHTIFISHSAYYFLVQQYGNSAGLSDGEWSIISGVIVTVLVTVLVHCFLAHRVYRLSQGNWIVTGSIIIFTLGHAALGITSTIRLFQIAAFARVPDLVGILSATLIIMAANDLLIMIALCWYLHKTQRPSGTHDAISLLTVYTIETGLLTSIVVTVDAICLLTMPRNWIFIGLEFCLNKLYTISLLKTLNSRHSVHNKFGNVPGRLTPSNDTQFKSPDPITSTDSRRVPLTTNGLVESEEMTEPGTRSQSRMDLHMENTPQQITFHDRNSPARFSPVQETAGDMV